MHEHTTSARSNPLVRHLVAAVVIKLLVLTLLWWFFIRDFVVRPETESVAAHITAPRTAPLERTGAAVPPASPQGNSP